MKSSNMIDEADILRFGSVKKRNPFGRWLLSVFAITIFAILMILIAGHLASYELVDLGDGTIVWMLRDAK